MEVPAPPRLEAAREALRRDGYRPLYEASAAHPLGLLRLEVWAGEAGLWLLRSLEAGEALALRIFALAPAGPACERKVESDETGPAFQDRS